MDTKDEWETMEKVKYVFYFMIGPAEIWFLKTIEKNPNLVWEYFCELMLDRFPNPSEMKIEISTCKVVSQRFDGVLFSGVDEDVVKEKNEFEKLEEFCDDACEKDDWVKSDGLMNMEMNYGNFGEELNVELKLQEDIADCFLVYQKGKILSHHDYIIFLMHCVIDSSEHHNYKPSSFWLTSGLMCDFKMTGHITELPSYIGGRNIVLIDPGGHRWLKEQNTMNSRYLLLSHYLVNAKTSRNDSCISSGITFCYGKVREYNVEANSCSLLFENYILQVLMQTYVLMRHLNVFLVVSGMDLKFMNLDRKMQLFVLNFIWFWDPGGKHDVEWSTTLMPNQLGVEDSNNLNTVKSLLLVKRADGNSFGWPKENEADFWTVLINGQPVLYLYELDFNVAQRENKIWDVGGKFSVDCSEMVFTTISGDSFPVSQSIITIITLCSNLDNSDSFVIELMVFRHSIRIWDPGGPCIFISLEDKAYIRGKECYIPKVSRKKSAIYL